jgi:hypothetical protein
MRIQNLINQLGRAAQRATRRLHAQRPADSETPLTTAMSHRPGEAESSKGAGENALTQASQLVRSREQRVHAWRRRVLQKKGARLHAASLGRGEHCALAVLDSQGIVVAWYDDAKGSQRVGTHVLDRHVSQFYLPADLASNLPGLNLLSAAMCGSNTQRGWRRQPSGAIMWCTTAIEAIVLKDGRLQGFTHVIRPVEGPRADFQRQMPRPSLRGSANARWRMKSREMSSCYASARA